MSLADILARRGIGSDATAYAAQAARLRRIAEAAGLPVDAVMRTAECDELEPFTDATLLAYARALAASAACDAGTVPEGWNAPAQCDGCGPVWLWPEAPAIARACPWCYVRRRGTPIPRPPVGAKHEP